ncbi:MAG: lipopolysaccharide transport periplasmic protein LptA [Proteobacteria bacterium]|nr:lipopolysaccharide transport periplasmic protein LptA [Pseudomonadota bacterium]
MSVYLSLFFLTFLSPVLAEEKKLATDEPINITSDQLEADKKAGIVTFTGNVVVKQKGGVMLSDLLNVYYDDQRRMEKIVARGNVRINQEDRVGTCQRATFFPDEKKIIMEEEPRLWKDSDVVSGKMITIYLDSDKILCESCSATIFQEKSGNGEGGLQKATDDL